jgi:hypothetical protein
MPKKICFAVAEKVVAARKETAAAAAAAAAAAQVDVARVPPGCVFGLAPFWAIVRCPACDAAGFIQEDVHALPPAPCAQCAYGHTYRIELDLESVDFH